MKPKVVIVGCGNVGMSYAYALVNQKTAVKELILIDVLKEKTEGEAMDLNHGIPFGPSHMEIKAGTYEDCHDADIVCITAGANQKPGETRLDLIDKNGVIFRKIISKIKSSGFQGIYLVATNPVDAMTYITWKESGISPKRVFGTGTSLDTARLRFLIGDKIHVNPKNVHAYVLGEHGDTEFVPWSLAKIGLEPVYHYLSQEEMEELHCEVRDAAYEIINRKGNTSYGIGMGLVRITNAILGNENSILAVSRYDEREDVYIGGPAIIDQEGIKKRIDLSLTDEEQKKYEFSIRAVKEAIHSYQDKIKDR